MANFPTKATGLSQGESPSLYSNELMADDNEIAAKADGGYEYRRPRFSRAPRREIETGFISVPKADFDTLEAFWESHLKHTAFSYYDQVRDQTYQVRFDSFVPNYKGIGINRRWDIKIKMSTI